jgi:ATP-dependent Lon protease
VRERGGKIHHQLEMKNYTTFDILEDGVCVCVERTEVIGSHSFHSVEKHKIARHQLTQPLARVKRVERQDVEMRGRDCEIYDMCVKYLRERER